MKRRGRRICRTFLLVLTAWTMCLSAALGDGYKSHLDITGAEREVLFAAVDAFDTSGKTFDEKVVISIAMPNVKAEVDYNNADLLTLWFRRHFNIEWDITPLPTGSIDDKVRTLIKSDSMPDVLRWDFFDITEIIEYIDQGYFYQFPEDWRERWPRIAALQDSTPVAEILRERTGGDTYVLFRPVFFFNNPTTKGTTHYGVFLRKDWAQAVGFELKLAYTPGELLEYARLIKEHDPGKVGDLLIPLSLYPSNARHAFIRESYPPYGEIYPEDGVYKWGFADERTLDGLKLWQQAYREGLISEEFYTLSSDDSKNAYQIYGVSGGFCDATNEGWVSNAWNGLKAQGLDPEESLWVAAVVGEDGYYHGREDANFWGAAFFSADIDPAVFERYMDMVEFTIDRDVQLFVNVGFENVDWKYAEDGSVEKIDGGSWYTCWPLYHLMSICGDDFTMDSNNVSELSWLGEKYSMPIYVTKDALVMEDSIYPIDRATYGFTSETQNRVKEIDLEAVMIDLIVSDGDLEENWKAAVAEYAYIIDPAVAELNALYGKP